MQTTNPQTLVAVAQLVMGLATVVATAVVAFATWRIWVANKRLVDATERYVNLMAESVEATKLLAEASRRQMEDAEISRRVERASLNAELTSANVNTILVKLQNNGPEEIEVQRIVLKYEAAEVSNAWTGSQVYVAGQRTPPLGWLSDVSDIEDKLRKTPPLGGPSAGNRKLTLEVTASVAGRQKIFTRQHQVRLADKQLVIEF